MVFLVADGAMEQMLLGFLGRDQCHRSLGCGPFTFGPEDVIVAQTHDPGVYRTAPDLLQVYEQSHRHAIVMLDDDWDGSPGPKKITADLTSRLSEAWEKFAVIVICPELEAWIWQEGNPHVAAALKCPDGYREILARSDHWPTGLTKPPRPKEALEHLRRKYRADRSKAAYRRLAEKIAVKNCQDPAFNHLRDNLRAWFPETS